MRLHAKYLRKNDGEFAMEFSRSEKLKELISKENNHLIKIITGIRRCGKSYLLNHIFKRYLLEKGIKEDHIIEFAFDFGDDIDRLDRYFPEEETRVHVKGTKNDYNIHAKKFRAYIKELTAAGGQYYLLLDEVQKLGAFESVLNGFLRRSNMDVYVTGSNSKFLSKDILTEFEGRGDEVHIFPLSFSEYYAFKQGDKGETYDEYSVYGGLPAVAFMTTEEQKTNYLISQMKNVYLRDIVLRYSVQDEVALSEVISLSSKRPLKDL